MLVNIDIKLSILVSKWAPSGKKFALGSSCNTLALGYYNTIENCWTSLSRDSASKIPITNSPITAICFHPSSSIIAVGSADFQVKIVTFSLKKQKS
jgi:actin related protein 2/3 complex subunit 1A/1B